MVVFLSIRSILCVGIQYEVVGWLTLSMRSIRSLCWCSIRGRRLVDLMLRDRVVSSVWSVLCEASWRLSLRGLVWGELSRRSRWSVFVWGVLEALVEGPRVGRLVEGPRVGRLVEGSREGPRGGSREEYRWQYSSDEVVSSLRCIGCDGRGLCLLILHLLLGVLATRLTALTLVYSLIQRVLLTLSVLTFFSGVRIEVGEFCNSLTEVPCCWGCVWVLFCSNRYQVNVGLEWVASAPIWLHSYHYPCCRHAYKKDIKHALTM